MAAQDNQIGGDFARLEALAADDQVSRLALMLAQAYLDQGKPAQAAVVIKRDLTLAKHDSHSQSVLSEVLESLDDVDGALVLVEEAAAEVCQQAGVFERLARLYEARGDEDAAAWAGRTAELLAEGPPGRGEDPWSSSATMADIYEAQGHAEEAKAIRRRLSVKEARGEAEAQPEAQAAEDVPAPPVAEAAAPVPVPEFEPAPEPVPESVAEPEPAAMPEAGFEESPLDEALAELSWDDELPAKEAAAPEPATEPEPLPEPVAQAAPEPEPAIEQAPPEPEPGPPDDVAWALERLERLQRAAQSRMSLGGNL